MIYLIILLILVLLVVIIIQISKVTELSSALRGEKEIFFKNNNKTAVWLLLFGILFLIVGSWSAYAYKDLMLGYGPLTAASEHGVKLDGVFNTTLIFTGIVFVVTQFLLFYFSFKYRQKHNTKAKFISHDNTLEYIWTGIPALVMTFLVVKGLVVWNEVMADVGPDEDVIEIEATGYQFAWDVRHPGLDGQLGEKKFELIEAGSNSLGLNFKDKKVHDDIIMDQIYLPVNKKVKVRITSKDVLHNFYLPHFRVKMDAVPGLPTQFVFTPTVTTEDFRKRLKGNKHWQGLADPTDPSVGKKWENFDYELACAELCGKGHYSMRKVVKIVSQAEYDEWLKKQTPFYMSSVRGKDMDPYKDELFDFEIKERSDAFFKEFDELMAGDKAGSANLALRNVNFETGSSTLKPLSKYELQFALQALKANPSIKAIIQGYTDNVGNPESNVALSQRRADTVMNFLINNGISADRLSAKGYGEANPVASNDTAGGRAENRRIEFKIIK